MPQMSPMLWLNLYLYFFFILIIIMMMIYYIKLFKIINNNLIKINQIYYKMMW